MRNPLLLNLLAVIAFGVLSVTAARADTARIKVATIDGAPVYHWTAFKSFVADDVDRALILREFVRKSFQLPKKIVDDAVQQEITDRYGGSSQKFAKHLHTDGVSMEEFRQFVAEEIAVDAMLNQDAKTPAEQARKRAEWLAGLRAGVTVKRISAKGQSNLSAAPIEEAAVAAKSRPARQA